MFLRLVLVLAMVGLGSATGSVALANPVSRAHIEVELVASRTAFVPGEPLELALRLTPDPGWHTYWENPGDSGEPTKIRWELPEGFQPSPLSWPAPQRLSLGPLTNFGYEHEVFLISEIWGGGDFSGDRLPISAEASWLVCTAEKCIPGRANLALTLPVAASAKDSKWSDRLRETRVSLPSETPAPEVRAVDRGQVLALSLGGGMEIPRDFFPRDQGFLQNHAVPQLKKTEAGQELLLAKRAAHTKVPLLRGVLTFKSGRAMAVAVAPEDPDGVAAAPTTSDPNQEHGIGMILLFAFIGGVLLNLMPCVFPVLSIKVLGFVEKSGSTASKLLAHGIAYALGILASFWVLAGTLIALRAGGAELGWGFQLQSPLFLAILCFLFVAVGLNLLGAFEVGSGLSGIGSNLARKRGYSGSFATGVLATIIATPCTAPFMGTAIGFALAQPPIPSLAVFTSLGVGMSFPYVFFSAMPSLIRRLPRPGAWMITFKQLMAFPILGTVVWLLSVIGQSTDLQYIFILLMGLVVFSMGLWAYGKAPRLRSWPAVVALLLLFSGLGVGTWDLGQPATPVVKQGVWEPYTQARLDELLAEARPTFIDFTASWCLTCQVNKRVVLDTDVIQEKFNEKGVTLLRADWTNGNAEISRKLEEFGRNGVPLYVLYSGVAGEAPKLLPQLLTKNGVIQELEAL